MRERGNIKPFIAVAAGAFLVLVVVPVWMNRNNSAHMATVDPHVSIGDTSALDSRVSSPAYRWPNSEVPRSAERLRDLTGVAIAAMSYVIEAEFRKQRPRSPDEILRDIAQRDLIPRQWLTAQPGALQMPNGTVWLRFSPNDLRLELLSVPRDRLDGPAFLIRLPDLENTSGGARYFESMQLDGIIYPPPFTPLPQVINAGWQPRLFKQTQLPDAQRAQLEQWAQNSVKP